jgi:hypothetical protein
MDDEKVLKVRIQANTPIVWFTELGLQAEKPRPSPVKTR